jgi:hypothetical protein
VVGVECKVDLLLVLNTVLVCVLLWDVICSILAHLWLVLDVVLVCMLLDLVQ